MVVIYLDLSRLAFCLWMVILLSSLCYTIYNNPSSKIRVFKCDFIGFTPIFCMYRTDA